MQRRTFLLAGASTAALAMFRSHLTFAKGEPVTDPLLAPFGGPYGGVPPFDKIKVADFKPALLKGMDLQRAELRAIADHKDAPTFENTILALEDSGRPYGRAGIILGIYTSTMNDKAMQKVEEEMAPKMSEFADEITQNEKLFARVKAVWDARGKTKLEPDQARLLETTYRMFARRGAALGAKQKERVKAINTRLAALYTKFGQNQLADEESQTIDLDKEADLAGCPDTLKAAMKAAADAKGKKGKWLITNTRSSCEPFLTYSTRRDLREKVWKMFISRGDGAGPTDNKPVITEILALRGEKAKILGFQSHAHWIIDDNMAKTPDAALALTLKVWRAAVARVKEEVADMQKIADAEKAGHKIAPWDYRFYAEKVRKAKYDLDDNEIKPYLQLDKMREAMFWAAGQVYGLQFAPVKGVPVYHKDVTVYEVTRGGARIGLWYFDPYAREGKRSGAWMNEYRTQEKYRDALTPIVSNNSNFVQAKPGEPVLISWADAETLFHEFGHALHGLNSNVRYPTLAGTNTLRDFVEFPSQLNEYWLATPEVLNKFAVHYKTGKAIPKELVEKIKKAKTFNQGFKTVEYMSSAIYDLKIHTMPTDKPIDPAAFEKKTMKDLGMPDEVVMRHRPTQFGHVFSGDDYSAGYYSYIWADTLTADAAEAFSEKGSFYDKDLSKKLHDAIMSVGNSIPPEEAFRRFRGRDVDTNAVMRDRGFPVTK
ncbi:MAG: M3 family metallopeptidase [Deltaproteobacteria bacterium]|nr:M3 family metallopeptidase [Deltaproteobacteria bacterium]MCW5804004.1 M3 family metallopeptidase [Deltaproteobacteria bacterium]